MPKNIAAHVERIMKSATTDIASLLGDAALSKAAENLTASEMVMDQWESGQKHRAPMRNEIVVGPREAATGSNTEKMNSEYSRNAPQMGPQADAEMFLMHLAPLHAAMKGIATAMKSLVEVHKGQGAVIAALLAKAEEDEEAMDKSRDEEEAASKATDEDGEFCAKATVKAAGFLTDAKALVSKATTFRKSATELQEDGEAAEAKALFQKARKHKKNASILLGKARFAASAARDNALIKSIVDFAKAEDVEVDEDFEKAMEDDGLEKAETTDMQADKQSPENGNQDAASVTAKALTDALTGMKAMETTVKSLIDTVNGTSRAASPVVKAEITLPPADQIFARIDRADESETLTTAQLMSARALASTYESVQSGALAKSVFDGKLDKAPAAVKAIFADLAA